MSKIYAVTWSREDNQQFTNFLSGKSIEDVRQQMLEGSIAKAVHGIVRMESMEEQ
jgi:hypothetical protein